MGRYIAMLHTDADDRDITEWGMAESGHEIPLKFINDKKELEATITQSGEPALILLNDRGAAHAGYEQLQQLKKDPSLNHIPVIILGEMSTRDYINECYRAGANSFIIKPSTVATTQKKIRDFFNYWLHVAEV